MRGQGYALGIIFTDGDAKALMIRKKRPVWQEGKLNGIGGKIEAGESPFQALAREFEEEAALDITNLIWRPFARLQGVDFEVHCFCAHAPESFLSQAQSLTDELVELVSLQPWREWAEQAQSNLPALVLIASDPDCPFAILSYRELALEEEAKSFQAS